MCILFTTEFSQRFPSLKIICLLTALLYKMHTHNLQLLSRCNRNGCAICDKNRCVAVAVFRLLFDTFVHSLARNALSLSLIICFTTLWRPVNDFTRVVLNISVEMWAYECILSKICGCVMWFDGDERQLGIVRFMGKEFFFSFFFCHSFVVAVATANATEWTVISIWFFVFTASFMASHKTDIQFLPFFNRAFCYVNIIEKWTPMA